MGQHVIKMPDVGEGIAEAELVEWHVKVGDPVNEDTVLAAVMTDKATVEIPSPVEGTVSWLGGEVGEQIAVGAPLLRIEVAGEGNAGDAAPQAKPAKSEEPEEKGAESAPREPEKATPKPETDEKPVSRDQKEKTSPPPKDQRSLPAQSRKEGEKPLASPAVRLRAREAGVDLRYVRGTGPAGRITHEDLDLHLEAGHRPREGVGRAPDNRVTEFKVVGLRRKIAEKMQLAKSRIPHITYVDEVEMGALEDLRATLNKKKRDDQARLTLMPFLVLAMVRAIREQPNLNSLYDDDAGVVHQHGGVHVGIATQTRNGLVVPVLRHAETLDLWSCAAEIQRLAEAARDGTATREELSGSTITITSLGALGGIATTPVINHPEVAIIGVNKMQVRPVWDGAQFVPTRMMNLSSSFDHRIIDGWDAAVFVQRIKALLETPASIFIEE
ncbi:2-oxo acid dehydrogenase subunit E2 [Nitratireductor mangrovi]|uniref:Dihydrolipoamide acetyltransferase component of pyruvate dehydrogenase complex n=1 Tax=Nitratireductor mangrovi TaxID=2599600 RepID=A0A5B8KTY2_9HYPH|nr:dihydrolipoamide acetyltransferase family protein [Nitratireductor mangrovi]QDY99041.1 2-oxo acid dehydrogenase subunit E2 [Nitratireductor mangrovi]